MNMVTDVNEGRKLIFISNLPFRQTDPNYNTIDEYNKLSLVDMPTDYPSGSIDTIELSGRSLISNPLDDYFKEHISRERISRLHFSTLPSTAIGWVKDEISDHYVAIFTNKGGWIGAVDNTAIHIGKVVAKIWWGNTDKSFGFSMNMMYGKPVFLWRVDADRSSQEAPLVWLSDIATQHNLKLSIGARGERISNDSIADYWRDLAANPLVEVGVHTYTHTRPISEKNITYEVIDTYELLRSYNIPPKKFFIGWGTSDWSWEQIETLFDYGWTVIQSSWDNDIVSQYDVNIIANFTVAPPLLGNTGRCDCNAYTENFNFTEVNIQLFNQRKQSHLPFIVYTHDYVYYRNEYVNDYGPIKDQIERFFDWLDSQEKYSVWITEYYDFFQDTFTSTITRKDDAFTVTRPNGKANFVKIFVGNNNPHAEGTSILTQKILDVWLYITLKPETTSTFTLVDTTTPEYNIALKSIGTTDTEINLGIKSFNGTQIFLPCDITVPAGAYIVEYFADTEYIFSHWQTAGAITLSGDTDNPVTINVSGDGPLIAVFMQREQHDNIPDNSEHTEEFVLTTADLMTILAVILTIVIGVYWSYTRSKQKVSLNGGK